MKESALQDEQKETFESCPLRSFSEWRLSDGAVRPHWTKLVRTLEKLGPKERARRLESTGRVIHEQGITYNVYGDPRGMERPWLLDPLPFLISDSEWGRIERGLIQRATLLNAILGDCYGAQRLVQGGWIPPALLLAQPEFLRPLHGVVPAGGRFLNIYAADIARSPDGQWWVVSDRTQIPTGMGYALANRLVTARMMPEAFRENGVERLAGFYRELQRAMRELAPASESEPRVVILTPGPYNETYFEQAYLARYLGYSLVEGQDLTVQDRRVFLKTLNGLEPVHVILRRVDDGFCDPLEMRNDSILGVPGLVEAVRSGNVAIANSLGSGILQSPAFKGFLAGLCRQVLGENLILPSIATWWCGQRAAEDYVAGNLDFLDVRPAFGGLRVPKNLGRKELRELVRFAPYRWVGQERIRFSMAPCWEGEGLSERPIVLRVFLVGTADGYVVMPGGLTRSGEGAVVGGISMQDGGGSKDTWVIREKPVDEVTLLSGATEAVELRRVGNNLPSRLADNFFWMGRYSERIDSAARVLRGTLLRFTPESVDSGFLLMQPLLQTLEAQDQIPRGASGAGRTAVDLERDFLAALFSSARSGSLLSLAENLVRIAMLVRDRTSNDVWRTISELEAVVTEKVETWSPGEAIALLNRVLIFVSAFKGIARENMTRAQGWRFLDMGQRIERAQNLCTFLRHTLASPEAATPSLLESVLEVADSTLTYRSRYTILPNLMAVYDLVLLDETNPRSLLFQLESLDKHFKKFANPRNGSIPVPAERILLGCLNEVRLLDVSTLSSRASEFGSSSTARVIDSTIRGLALLSETIAVTYFEHSSISRVGA